jgi:hypothetical protein
VWGTFQQIDAPPPCSKVPLTSPMLFSFTYPSGKFYYVSLSVVYERNTSHETLIMETESLSEILEINLKLTQLIALEYCLVLHIANQEIKFFY